MSKRSLAALAAIAALFCAPKFRAQSIPSPELPSGPMQAKATTSCTECHDSRIIVQQRLSKAAWTKEVDKMAKWGAVVSAQDHDALIDYLSANFGVDRPAYTPDKTASSKPGKK